ncbi:hypothetical protein N7454_004488 [Penicillium verhagenii]|nr:hypothetical protein N7454_004488 [Penicillium verhagenii]
MEEGTGGSGSGSLVAVREDRTWESWDERLGRCFQFLALGFAVLSEVLFGLTGKNMTPREIAAARGGSLQTLGARKFIGRAPFFTSVCAFLTKRGQNGVYR